MFKKIIALSGIFLMLNHATPSSGVAAINSSSILKVYNDFKLPLDPSKLGTMSEYNLSLCLFRTLFELDDASMPTTRILESWNYQETDRAYLFKIKKNVIWSDGLPLVAQDIAYSITRLSKSSPGNYTSVSSLLKGELGKDGSSHSGLTVIDDRTLKVSVHAAGPELFKRLSATFVPLVRKDQVNGSTGIVSSHKVSLGPYTVNEAETSQKHLVLDANAHFYGRSESSPKQIIMRPYSEGQPDLSKLGSSESWANIILDRPFIPTAQWKKLKSSGASLWTRPVDRVMYVVPTKAGMKRGNPAAMLQSIGKLMETHPIDFSQYIAIQPAKALQPPGFPLYKPISYQHAQSKNNSASSTQLLKMAVASTKVPSDIVVDYFKKSGINLEVKIFPVSELMQILKSDEFDLILRTVGAADPDPITWLTLMIESDYRSLYDPNESMKKSFAEIKNMKDTTAQHEKLVKLIHDAGAAGYYLPLAHFSSVAIAGPGFSLENIRQTDETVDLSKVRVVNAL